MAADSSKLAKYRSMRDFRVTDEPARGGEREHGNSYVIQKHDASHLHYDFRLELDGVLLSWSVPKGPSLRPKDRRLAVRTEDHPVSYRSFEGTIPQGQYGGGTVAVWDQGTWTPDGDPHEMMAKGRLKFTLAGEKLRGRWHLVKTAPRGKQETWLLFKGRDADADDETDIVATRPDSVISGRSLAQIAAGGPPSKAKRDRPAPAAKPPGKAHRGGAVNRKRTGARAPAAAKTARARGRVTSSAAKSSATKPRATSPTAKPRAKSSAKSTAAKPRAKSTAAKSTAAKSTAAKSTTAKSTAANPRAKSTAAKSTAAKSPAAKSTAAKPRDLATLDLGFRLTSTDRVIYPATGTTKGELFAYLAAVGERMLPHVAHRPLSIVRCPGGQGKKCFFQKHRLSGAPDAIGSVAVTEADGDVADYMQVTDLAGIIALAQHGTLEFHTWGSRVDDIETPDIAVFDLDPDVGLDFEEVAKAALELRDRLAEGLGLRSFAKTTGGKGLHVVVPLQRELGWDALKELTKHVAEDLERAAPDRFTTNMAKHARAGKIFIDYLRNGRGATFVAPYSPRARDGATVATPVSWDEVEDGLDPAAFTLETVPTRLALADPWAAFGEVAQAVPAATLRKLGLR